MYQELDHVIEELEKIAVVHLLQHRSIISLVGNVQRSSLILEKVILPNLRNCHHILNVVLAMFRVLLMMLGNAS